MGVMVIIKGEGGNFQRTYTDTTILDRDELRGAASIETLHNIFPSEKLMEIWFGEDGIALSAHVEECKIDGHPLFLFGSHGMLPGDTVHDFRLGSLQFTLEVKRV